jgi:hypothetical protein
MREDMYKVIVERPRHGRYFKSEYPCPHDLEESPKNESLKKRHRARKYLNENLSPLKRFLAKQVNRPWDKVFSELCKHIDRRNTVQQHIHEHIDGFVARHVTKINGELYSTTGWRNPWALSHPWQSELYVDPDTGILRKNSFREKTRAEEKQKRMLAIEKGHSHRRKLDAQHQLVQLEGIWYFVTVETVPEKPDKEVCHQLRLSGQLPMDVIRNLPAWDCATGGNLGNHYLLGDYRLYASAKRQLNSRELKRYGLHNIEKEVEYE